MLGLADHLIIVPILLPMLAAVVLLLIEDRHQTLKVGVSLVAIVGLLAAAIALVAQVGGSGEATARTYLLGNWPAPFAIVLVADRLSAMMVLLLAILAAASFTFALARWHKAGVYFHSLFQFQLMGLSGAFLTGDLFNLFVFFEVMLAASYGLMLHGSGSLRVRAGLHYIAINLATSSLFLIGVALIYATTGTLNMADLAARIPLVTAADQPLLAAGAAFLVKAGMWPLGFWLPTTYGAAAAPVAALFAIMSKVGIYVVLRLSLLLFGAESGALAGFGASWLYWGGMATLAFGMIGMLAAQDPRRMAGYAVLVSSGTLLALTGQSGTAVTAASLFYLISSTLTIGAFFLLTELMARSLAAGADVLAVTLEAFGDDEEEQEHDEEVGSVIPATLAILGVSFVACGLLLAGMPPFSGFIAKFAIIAALFGSGETIAPTGWALTALLMVSGLAALIAMVRTGINTFWVSFDSDIPRVRVIEIAPILLLLGLCLALTLGAGGMMGYLDAASAALHHPQSYIDAVFSAPQVPLVEGSVP